MEIYPSALPSRTIEPFAELGLRGAQVLFVASTGGHIAQAARLHDLIEPGPGSQFVTFHSPQTDSLASRYPVEFVPYVAPRDVRGVARALPLIREMLRDGNFDAVISTGAGVALSALPFTPKNTRSIYIESFSRFDGPSLTGRILSRIHSVETYTQHPEWATERWHFVGSIAPDLQRGSSEFELPTDRAPKVFVTLGTIKPYRFDALVDAVTQTLPDDSEITWQLGCTNRTDLPGRSVDMLSAEEFDEVATDADLIISHGGVGTALSLVEMGRPVLLVPRRASRGEHIDDHQVQVCRDFSERGLVKYGEVEDLRLREFGFSAAG